MTRRELQSQLYGFLGDCTSNADGDVWDHDRLRGVVARLIELPTMRELLTRRADAIAAAEEESA